MSMSDKMFDTFKNKQMDNIKKVEFSIQKQVGLTKAGDRYKIESKRYGESNGRHGVKKQRWPSCSGQRKERKDNRKFPGEIE